MKSTEKITYYPVQPFTWQMPDRLYSRHDLDELCESCDSIRDKQIEELQADNKKLRKIAEFLRTEIKAFELETAITRKAVPVKKMVNEVTSSPEGKGAWEKVWQEQFTKWQTLVRQGKMSKMKYYRLINGMDQAELSRRLGTAQPNISRIEKPGYNVPVKTLKKLAKIFHIKVEDIIGD